MRPLIEPYLPQVPRTAPPSTPDLSQADPVVGHPVVADEDTSGLLPDVEIGSHEPASRLAQRLVELAEQVGVLPDLGLGQPFAAQPVQPGPAVLDQQVERVVAEKSLTRPIPENAGSQGDFSCAARSPSRGAPCPRTGIR